MSDFANIKYLIFFIFVSILVDSYITITEFHLGGGTGGIWILRGEA